MRMLKILKKIFLKKCMVCLLELIFRLNFYFSVLIYWLIGGTRYNYSLHWVIIQYHATGPPWWISQWRIHLQCRKPNFDPWVGKIPWRRKWQPTPGLLPGKIHGHRSLKGYSPSGHKRQTRLNDETTISLL